MAFVACTEGADDVVSETNIVPEINLETSSVDFTEDGGSATINFTSTDAWTASVDSDGWCSVNPKSGNAGSVNIVVSADANSEVDDRTATVTIRSGSVMKTISISQSRKSVVALDGEKYTVDGIGGSIEVEVNHNVDYDITFDCDWITLGETRALETDNIAFVVTANESREARTGHITIAAKNGTTSQQITVDQNACDFKIYYTSTDGQVVIPNRTDVFGANIVSNRYENGVGVITFDGRITSIGYGAFNPCWNLASIIIPNSVTSIGSWAFRFCDCLTSVTIPDSVTEIGALAFSMCESLTSVTFGNSVTMIGSGAFDGCDCLTSVTIPDSVTAIGEHAFSDCKCLTSFYGKFASADNRYLIINGVLNSFASAGLAEYTIPNSVAKIGDCAFYGCNLISITIPDSVTSIGKSAFEFCDCLTSITIPDSVTLIEYSAFSWCTSLTNVYCKPTAPPTLGLRAFIQNASDRKIYVPAASVDAYKTAANWSDYKYYIEGCDF